MSRLPNNFIQWNEENSFHVIFAFYLFVILFNLALILILFYKRRLAFFLLISYPLHTCIKNAS